MDLISLLKQTNEETLKYFSLPEKDLSKTYQEGKWTIRQILVHLSDAEGVLLERIKRTIAEPRQVLSAFDQDLWSEHLNYETFPLDISKAVYSANRQTIIYLAGKYYHSHGHKEFIHSQTGVRTLKDEFEKVGVHNEGHLEQIRVALGG